MTKLIQICASEDDLFGLDGEGAVYHYNFNTNSWMRLGRVRRGEAGGGAAEGGGRCGEPGRETGRRFDADAGPELRCAGVRLELHAARMVRRRVRAHGQVFLRWRAALPLRPDTRFAYELG